MKACDQFNAFLNQFESHTARIQVGHAYKIKQGDVVDYIANNVAELITPKGRLEFTHEQSVSLGDYIFYGSLGSSYHVSQTMFKRLFCDKAHCIALPGQPLVEESFAGNPLVWHSVIKINDRYFSEFKNGRVMTAWCIEGAKKFKTRNNPVAVDQIQKIVAELQLKKKKPKVLEVGYWSRHPAGSEEKLKSVTDSATEQDAAVAEKAYSQGFLDGYFTEEVLNNPNAAAADGASMYTTFFCSKAGAA